MNRAIWETVLSLGITPKYRGYFYIMSMLELILQFEENPKCLSPIYRMVARQYAIPNAKAIPASMDAIICRAWRCNALRLSKMAGRPLSRKPTPKEFVMILANYLR